MKVLLIWPKARTDPDWGGDLGAIAEPLSLEYLAATVKQAGHSVKILDLRLFPDVLEKELLSYNPDVVGVTSFSMHVSAGLSAMRKAKELLPDCITIAGGHHASILPEDFFEPQVDMVVCGEGTHPLRQIMERIENKESYAGIAGVYYKNVSGEFIFNGKQGPFSIDDLPLPDRTVTEAFRHRYFIDWMMPVALLRTSVGCPYRCTFCSLWKVMDGRYEKGSIDRIIEDVKQIKEDFVFLVDDEAFIDSKRMLRMALAFKEAGIKKRFFAYCRIDSIIRNKEVLREWKEVGLERLFVGVDAISEKDLKEYNKRLSINQIENGLSIAKELGIEIFAQFVVNVDYKEEDFKYLVRFIEHYKLEYPSFTVLTPLPGTALLKEDFSNVTMMQKNGRPNWDFFDTQSLVMPSSLEPDQFRKRYRGLFKIFSGAYSRFLIHKPVYKQGISSIN
jgi:radical SAM superfamily enzyme YgiQ (UPF0313 family)